MLNPIPNFYFFHNFNQILSFFTSLCTCLWEQESFVFRNKRVLNILPNSMKLYLNVSIKTCTSTMSAGIHVLRLMSFATLSICPAMQSKPLYYSAKSAATLYNREYQSCVTGYNDCQCAWFLLVVTVNVVVVLLVIHKQIPRVRADNCSCVLLSLTYVIIDCMFTSHSTWLHAFSEMPYNSRFIDFCSTHLGHS